MRLSKNKKKKLYITILSAFVLIIASFFIYNLLVGFISLANKDNNVWDGVTVSTTFSSGNGTEENPYIIYNGEDLSYLKQLIEGQESALYNDKYYELANDIDLGDKNFESIGQVEDSTKIFKGTLNGNGYTIKNAYITAKESEKEKVYGLFTSIENASIININIDNLKINPVGVEKYIVGSLAGKVLNNNVITNVSIVNSKIDTGSIEDIKEFGIGSLSYEVGSDCIIKNVILDVNIQTKNENEIYNITGTHNSNLINVVLINQNNSYKKVGNDEERENIIYEVEKNNETLEINEEILNSLNEDLNDYVWITKDNKLLLTKKEENTNIDMPVSFAFSTNEIPVHESGIVSTENTMYVNDLESDLNYYEGLNYTYSTNGKLPSTENQHIFDNLVEVHIQYNGQDLAEPTNIGYMGPDADERISKLNYYKYYHVVDGKITIELIDNPYALRPGNLTFHGWLTAYQNVFIWYDEKIHTYYAEVDVTNATGPISIVFNASWREGKVGYANDNSFELEAEDYKEVDREVPSGGNLYEYGGYVNRNRYYPYYVYTSTGEYTTPSNRIVCRQTRCNYYEEITSNSIDPSTQYYQLIDGEMMPAELSYDETKSSAGLYEKINATYQQTYTSIYDSSGNYLSNTTCNSRTGCTYYKRIQYLDENGEINKFNNDKEYAYLVTRDNNILIVTEEYEGEEFNFNTKATLTALENGSVNENGIINIQYSYIKAGNDLRIEFIKLLAKENLNTNDIGTGTQNQKYIYGNYHNLKIGRGISGKYTSGGWWSQEYDRINARYILGGSNDATANTTSTAARYKLIVETGKYVGASVVRGTGNQTTKRYVDAQAIYGNDYDRVKNNNENLIMNYTIAGSFSGYIYAADGKNTSRSIKQTVKSGDFGKAKNSTRTGMYVGGLSYGKMYSVREAIIEGGKFFNIIGGPISDAGKESNDINDIFINVKGGEIDFIFGGAARTETYGNRIINVTGGKINNAVFGGSNGIESSDSNSSRGTLSAKSLVYVGGNAEVGNSTGNITQTYGVTKAAVFGQGNGKSGNGKIGSTKQSNVIINGGHIYGDVYGGGNYAAVGADQNSGEANVNLKILKGNITGNVYGGGNNNGAGNENVLSNVNINIYDGEVGGSVFGGSNTTGTVYGPTTINMYGGTVGSIYGAGLGYGTYVRDNIRVNIHDGVVNNNVYGGSSQGTSNGIQNKNTYAIENTKGSNSKVVIEGGIIKKNVFAGGEGGSSTPNVLGDVEVTLNNGSVNSIYGGNDKAGKPSLSSNVYLNGGDVANVFGGGNETGHNISNIYLQGSNVTTMYGGSNVSGEVTTTNITMTSGTIGNMYGGNNLGGSTQTDNITISGGTINGDIYGGGNSAAAKTTYVNINDVTTKNVFGGSKSQNATYTNIELNNVNSGKIFGGSDSAGTVEKSKINVTSVGADSIYGGNNAGGTTKSTNITFNSGNVGTVYGGGDAASSTDSHILIIDGNIGKIYGGGNKAGLDESNVDIAGGTIGSVFGGSNISGNQNKSKIKVGYKGENVLTEIECKTKAAEPWMGPTADETTYSDVTFKITNNSNEKIERWESEITFSPGTRIHSNYNGTKLNIVNNVAIMRETDQYNNVNVLQPNGGTYQVSFGVLSATPQENFSVSARVTSTTPSMAIIPEGSRPNVTNVFGGNDQGGVTKDTDISIKDSTVQNVYGGGNKANVESTNVVINNSTLTTVYGGGNEASVTKNTYLDIDNSTASKSVFGGGNSGEVKGDTQVFITNTTVEENLYGGGNGARAIVRGNSSLDIDGKTVVGTPTTKAPFAGSVFGGGNAAATGTEGSTTSKTTVNIAGAYIYGNVYGGANTSVVYGATKTNIGYEAVTNKTLNEDDIVIIGTVFGGGESNPTSEDDQDINYNFLSVIGTIDIMLDGTNYREHNHRFEAYGSIFGSGHASSSQGTSTVYVKKLGTPEQPSPNDSFQRINYLTIDNSVMELKGIKDIQNVISDAEISFNMIDSLILKNNSTLLMRRNSKLLKSFYSGTDESGELTPAVVTIDESGNVTKNVDNRIYMLAPENMYVTTSPDATSYGQVTGMTFFGMYLAHISGSYQYGMYDRSYNSGDAADASTIISGGSYVLGLHAQNHDITKDGFYTNVIDEEYTHVTAEYIDPEPDDTNFYRWIVGTPIVNYKVDLVASKYSSVGTAPAVLLDYGNGNTIFEVIGFNVEGLLEGVELIDPADVPKLATSPTIANRKLGLAMKAETREWTSYGTTKLLTAGKGSYSGTESYLTDNNNEAPSFMFYLYHAKNITLEENIGTVVLTIQALTPKNIIEYQAELFTITINITAKTPEDGNNYDAAMTYDKKYTLPSATAVNITNRSQFTAYYSLFATANNFEEIYGRNNENYHALVSNYALPVGTQITMIDYAYDEKNPNYYYYDITQEVYDKSVAQLEKEDEITYKLSEFIRMGSTSPTNKYDDKKANKKYYNETYNVSNEEFIFIFDLKETTTTGESIKNSLLFELRTSEDRTKIYVSRLRRPYTEYSLYDSSNAVLKEEVNMSNYMYYNLPTPIDFKSEIAYDQTGNQDIIIDTNYESSNMGLNIYVYDNVNNQISSTLLTGTNIKYDGRDYFADGDGVYRIKLANKVSNIQKNIEITPDETLPEGQYTFKFVLFASDDGLHNSRFDNTANFEKQITLVGADNALVVSGEDYNKVVDGDTSLNQNKTSNNRYNINVHSVFSNPNVRLSIYKRDTSTEASTEYIEIPFDNLFTNLLYYAKDSGYQSEYQHERMIDVKQNDINLLELNLKDNLTSGTYKLCFRLYDGNQLIEEDLEYVIVSKKVETTNNNKE